MTHDGGAISFANTSMESRLKVDREPQTQSPQEALRSSLVTKKEHDMAAETNLLQRWEGYRPSKVLWFWSCIGVVILTIVVGFWAGGWTTGGTAQKMARDAADEARAELVANACIKNFTNGSDFQSRLTAFKTVDAWKRADVLEEKGWVTLAGMGKPLAAAAKLCADELAKIEPSDAAAPAKSAADSSG